MGNSSSASGRGHHDESVDYGFLYPQGIYTGSPDWDQSIVSHLIVARKLAPFYRPLEDYDDSWDDEQILAAKKELPDHSDNSESVTHAQSNKYKRPVVLREPTKAEAQIYRGAVECPICFLVRPFHNISSIIEADLIISTIRRISIILGVVIKLFALNALFRLSAMNLLLLIWSLNPLHVPIAFKKTLVSYTPHPPGELALAVKTR